MSAAPLHLGLDVGTAMTRIAADGTRTRVLTSRTPAGTMPDRVRAALGMVPRPVGRTCVIVPDAWFGGTVSGALAYEKVRHACEDEYGIERITWAGQMAAVAASCSGQRGQGNYLVCDIGYAGVRAGSFTVGDGTVRTTLVMHADGCGWSDFDRSVRGAVGDDPLPHDWYTQAAQQADRAGEVFKNAAASPDHEDDRAYRLTGQREHRLTARQMMDCFAPVREALGACVTAAAGAGWSGTVVLTGGLGWFPLAGLTVSEAARTAAADIVVTRPDEAVRGALLFARREVSAEPPAGPGAVSLPMHRVSAGLLVQESLDLPWHEPFARPPEGTLSLDREELVLMIAGQYRTFRLPGLVPGRYRIGVRAGWSDPGVLIVRAETGDIAHIISLAPADDR